MCYTYHNSLFKSFTYTVQSFTNNLAVIVLSQFFQENYGIVISFFGFQMITKHLK
jgi:hypothetical protein